MAYLTPHQEKALNYKNHISLTANAGSGKTFVLSKRFLKIITEENISLRNIAAITFTDKAASELYKKIAIQIEEEIKATSDEKEIRKLESIRRQLVSANISTIHSFCIDILREHPVEAELDANFSPVDESTSEELIELSVEEMIKDSLKNKSDEDKLKNLIRIYSSKNLLAKELITLVKNRKNVLTVADKIYSKPEAEIALFFHQSFLSYFEKIFQVKIDAAISSLNKINEVVFEVNNNNQYAVEIRSLINRLSTESDNENIIKILLDTKNQALTKDNKVKSRGYLKSDLRGGLQKEIDLTEQFFEGFSKLDYQDNFPEVENELARFGKDIIYFFSKAIEIYGKKKKDNGYLDYEDILLHTKNILELENVRKDLSEKYKYIMIDEYQDTNEIQYNIFLPILEKLKTGNLFVVGDEKQSIYMFRDAELEVFDVTKNDIKSASGPEYLLTLPDSFRMAPAVCLFANLLFKKLFAEPNLLFNEVEHSDLVCARTDDNPGKIEILLTKNNNEIESVEKNTNIFNFEAEIVAKRILKLIYSDNVQGKIIWNDIAVLCRKRKYFNELEKTFVKYNIPFVILGGKGFYQKQTVYDIYNYFSFLADKQNDTALIGILRSTFFSMSDSQIFEISLKPGKNYWEKLQHYIEENNEFKNIALVLKENLSLAQNYDITALLRKILNETDLLAVLASKQNGNQELANVEKLIKLTINYFTQGFKTLYDYVNFLRDSIEQFEDEAQAAVADESNSVKIMTFHQSKGLEFDNVFLYGCNESIKKESIRSKSINVNKKFGLLTKIPLNSNYSSEYSSAPIIGISNLISEKKNIAEFKRLFYVGVTRAKNNLFISAALNKDDESNTNSFLALLQKSFGVDLNSQSFNIKSDLKFLLFQDNKYGTVEKEVSTEIKILNTIEYSSQYQNEGEKVHVKKLYKIGKIKDNPKGEIISATKISVYKQCPLKYYLTYDLGYTPFFQKYKKWTMQTNLQKRYEFNEREDEALFDFHELTDYKIIKEFSDVKGRVIHSVLQKEINQNQLESFIEESIINELSSFIVDEKQKTVLKNDVLADLINFYASKEYSDLKNYKNYYNEYEVYSKENDYFLYGIIDKLIIEDNKAIIVDYKTDLVAEEELEEKSKSYFNQLRFYSYIVNRLFDDITSYELRLIFIKLPQHPQVVKINIRDFELFKQEIESIVNNMRNQNYIKKLQHCPDCYYSIGNNRCIKN